MVSCPHSIYRSADPALGVRGHAAKQIMKEKMKRGDKVSLIDWQPSFRSRKDGPVSMSLRV